MENLAPSGHLVAQEMSDAKNMLEFCRKPDKLRAAIARAVIVFLNPPVDFDDPFDRSEV
jgi:hypothetical protein